jgi:hypothetical protein
LTDLIVHLDRRAWYSNKRKHVLSKSHLVRPKHPAHQDTAERIKCHEGGVDGPLVLDPSCVQNHQARHALETDQGSSCQLPGIVTGIEPRRSFEIGHIIQAICGERHLERSEKIEGLTEKIRNDELDYKALETCSSSGTYKL